MENGSLQTVSQILSDGKLLAKVVEMMTNSDAWNGLLARDGDKLKHSVDKELNSTLTTVSRFLRFLNTPAMVQNTSSSSFDYGDLRKRKMTVYLVMPPQHLRSHSGWLRMQISSALRAVVKQGLGEDRKVHMVLDEAAALGHMEALDDAIAQFRGYGIRCHFFYQSMGQLHRSFPEGGEQTLLSNTSQLFFGTNENDTSEYVSKRLGEETIVVGSGSTTRGGGRNNPDMVTHHSSGSSSSNWSETSSWQQVGRALLKPEEVCALDERTCITFTQGVAPLCTRLVRYYEKGSGRNLSAAARLKDGVRLLMKSGMLASVCLLLALVASLAAESHGKYRTFQPQPFQQQQPWEQQFIPLPPQQPFNPPQQWQPAPQFQPQPVQPPRQPVPFRPQQPWQPWQQQQFHDPRQPIT